MTRDIVTMASGVPVTATPPIELTATRLAAFALPGIPISGLGIPLLAYLPNLYATRVGLPLATVGAIFLLVRLADIGLDPLIGAAMDRYSTRWGRFRPWLSLGMPLLLMAVVGLFNPPAAATNTYLAGWLALAYVGYSVCYLAHLSWGAALSDDYAERSRVFAWWQAGLLLGYIVVLATPIIVQGLGHAGPATGIAAMGWVIASLLPVTIVITIAVVPEPRSARRQSIARPIDYLRLMARPTIARLLVADLVIGTAIGMNSALFFFYFGFVKAFDPLSITILLFLNLCGSLCGTPIWNWLTDRAGKHRASAFAFFFYAVSLVAIDLMPSGLTIACIILFAAGLTLSAGPLLLRSMMADAGDEELLRSGQDRTGLLSALFSGTNKLGLALAPGITFAGLGLARFEAAGPNGADALLALRLLYIAGPALLGCIAAIIVRGHKLTAERHVQIREKLRTAGMP